MALPISLDRMRTLLVAVMRSLFTFANVASRRSYHGRKATYLSSAATSINANVAAVARDSHPLTAGPGKPINQWGDAFGVQAKSATGARKASAGRVRGAAAATASIGDQLRHDQSGLLFELASNVTIPGVAGVDPDSFADADIVAIDVGSQTRLQAGSVLKFLSPPTDIEGNVVLQLDLDEDGFDAEQFGGYRARVLSTISQTASGGSQADFVKWTLASLNSIVTAYAYPQRAGRATIDVVGFTSGTGSARSLTPDERDAVLSYIRSLTTAPFHVTGTGGGLRCLETIADPRTIEITIEPNGQRAFAFDWDDGAPPEVASWNPTTRELQFDVTLPASLRAGHRLVLKGVASAQDGEELTIESISGVDKLILQEAPTVAPVATDLIYSGGPLVTPIRDAIVAHLNGEIVYAGRNRIPLPASSAGPTTPGGQSIIGLEILAEGIGSANPAGRYSQDGISWTGAIIRETLSTIAGYKAGVRKSTVVLPASDYEAEDDGFPLDAQIHYVTPGSVVVRSA